MPSKEALYLVYTIHGNADNMYQFRILLKLLGRKECEAQIKGFPHARFQKFPTRHEAEAFVAGAFSSDSSAAQTATSVNKGKKRDFRPEVHDVTGWDIVYSDGACKGNGKAGSVAGVGVWWGRDDPRYLFSKYFIIFP